MVEEMRRAEARRAAPAPVASAAFRRDGPGPPSALGLPGRDRRAGIRLRSLSGATRADRRPPRRRHRPRGDRRRREGAGERRRAARARLRRSTRARSARRRSAPENRRSPTRRSRPASPPTPSSSAPSATRRSTLRRRKSAPRRGSSRSGRRSASTRTSGRRRLFAGLERGGPLKPEIARGPRPRHRPRADGRALLRDAASPRSRGRDGRQHPSLHARRDRPDRRGRLPDRRGAAEARHVGRQVERPRDVAALARRRDRGGRRGTRTCGSSTSSSTRAR